MDPKTIRATPTAYRVLKSFKGKPAGAAWEPALGAVIPGLDLRPSVIRFVSKGKPAGAAWEPALGAVIPGLDLRPSVIRFVSKGKPAGAAWEPALGAVIPGLDLQGSDGNAHVSLC